MARQPKNAPAPAPVALVTSSSSFDFLEGAFSHAQKTRKTGLGVAAGAVAVLTALALLGVSGMLSKNSQQAQLDATLAQEAQAKASLARIDNAGGYSAERLQAHVNERQKALRSAVGSEMDVVGFLRQIRASAPAGVQVTGVTFKDAAGAVTNAAPVAGTTAPAPAAQTGSGADQIGTVEIKGTVSSFALIGSWAKSVSTVTGLSGVNPTWTGGGNSISTTLTATVNQSGLTKRAEGSAPGQNSKVAH